MMTSGESVVNVQTKKAKKNIVSFLPTLPTPYLSTTEKRRRKTFSSIFSSFLLANANVMMMMMKWMTFHENRVSVDTFCRLSSFLSYLL